MILSTELLYALNLQIWKSFLSGVVIPLHLRCFIFGFLMLLVEMFVSWILILGPMNASSYPLAYPDRRHLKCFDCVPIVSSQFLLIILHVVLNNPTNTLTKHLFSNCPSFEDLSIQASWGSDGPLTNFIISLVTLNRLYFCVKCRNLSFCRNENTILITAPNLDFLYVMGLIPFNKPQWVSVSGMVNC
ncbi:hypothetical protein CUMW_120980 [Citrus unshiu]|nr:hypothetical protein CUMW_120980 [Citrus unshiu]